ncbi:MAG: VWA domain-containing protein [Lentisphaeraceae bacterium]|nr:VWA domain-containing protein [Lentisphaeraceae bacterium]
MVLALFFQNLSFLGILLPLLAIPLAIHILNKKFPRLIPFSNIQMIKESAAQRSKLFKMRHIILLLLRTLALLLLIFCFLKPIQELFGFDAKTKGERSVVIILDQSLSMNTTNGGLSSAQKSIIELEKIIDSLEANDEVNLVTLEKTPRVCFRQMNTNHGELLSFARSIKPGITNGEVTRSITMSSSLLKKSEAPKKEIFFISDFQRSNWGKAEFTSVPKDVKMFFIDVSPKSSDNKAILSASVLNSTIIAGDEIILDVKIGNFSDKNYEDRLEVSVNGGNEYYQDFKIAPWSIISTKISVPVHSTGIHEVKLSIKPDDLPQDNSFYVSLKALDKEEVLIITDEEDDPSQANFFLSSALNPYAENKGALMPRLINTDSLSPIHLASTGKVFITGIHNLSQSNAKVLTEFMNKGGSVLYYMDGNYDSDNLKTLQKELPSQLPFSAGLKQNSENIPGGSLKIRSGSFNSKFLKLFSGKQKQQLASIDFYEYYHTRATGTGKTLLKFAEGTPAMGSCRVGLGQLLLCNFSLREHGSNLAGKRLFPAWIHELNRQMSKENRKLEHYEAGEPIKTEVWFSEMSGNTFLKPDQTPLKVKSSRVNDDRLLISFTPTFTGHYNLKRNAQLLYSFPVNCSSEEADLRKIDAKELPSRTNGAAFALSGAEPYDMLNQGRPVYHWFLITVLSLLTLELFFFQLFRRLSA